MTVPMIRLRETTRARLMATHGFAMIGLGIGLLYIRSSMTNVFYYVFGSAFAMLLFAASMLFIAVLDWLCAIGSSPHRPPTLRGLLLLSTIAAALSVFLVCVIGTTIQVICYLTAVYALLLSIGKFHLARFWNGSDPERKLMYLLALTGVLFACLLVVFAGQDERRAITVIAAYSLFLGLQMLLSMFYLQRNFTSTGSTVADSSRARL